MCPHPFKGGAHNFCLEKNTDIVSLAHNVSFWAQKLTHSVSFWTQKLTHYDGFWAQKTLKVANFCSN